MSITSPIAVDVGYGSINLNKINTDAFASTYFGSAPTYEVTLSIRHSKEKAAADGSRFYRHNVDLTVTLFATADAPEFVRQVYTVIRHRRDDDLALVLDTGEAVVDFLTDTHITDLLAWIN